MPAITEENRKWWTLGAMCFALFMVMLDNTVVNIALPAIQTRFDATLSNLSWAVNAYTLVFGVLLVTGGRLGDVFGRKRMFLGGIVVFTLGSIGAGLSQSINELIFFRGLQGAGAAFLMPGSLSIITNTFKGSERGRALGLWAGISGLALGMGPVVGGVLVEKAGWEWIFFLNVPVALIAIPVTMYAVQESRDETAARRIDWVGILTLSVGLGALRAGGRPGQRLRLDVAAHAHRVRDRRRRPDGVRAARSGGRAEPMLDLNFFRDRNFNAGNVDRVSGHVLDVRDVLLRDHLHAAIAGPLADRDRRAVPADDDPDHRGRADRRQGVGQVRLTLAAGDRHDAGRGRRCSSSRGSPTPPGI